MHQKPSQYLYSLSRLLGHLVSVRLVLFGLALFACAWVGLVIDLGQVLKIQVSIDLGGGNIGVTEQFLHGPQVAAGFEQVARK